MKFLPLAFSLSLIPALSPGAIVTSGNFKTGTATVDTPTMTITADIVFRPTTNLFGRLVFDEWVTSDGSVNGVGTNPTPQKLKYRINGGPTLELQISGLYDNMASDGTILTSNDGLLQFATIQQTVADQTFTILAQTFTFTSNANFNQPPAVFTGNVFLASGSSIRSSNNVGVPEPATASLGALGALAMLRRRR